MAKQKSPAAGQTGKPLPGDTYVFLIKNTPLGSMDEKKWQEGAKKVTQTIRELGGDCTFYETTGETYDGVSVVTGLSLAHAVYISRLINSFGTVVATRMSGVKTLTK
jgi:hypothetical protein